MKASAAVRTRWLWYGYLAPGSVTLLTAQWKAGKTTLLTALLGKMKAGGKLAGRAVAKGRALVVSEEGPEHWLRRAERVDLGGHVNWICRPFTTRPTAAQWQGLIGTLADAVAKRRLSLVAIDPLASFLPGGDENSAAAMLEALLPLSALTARGAAVLLLHHPRKGEQTEGQMARGSGALPGFVDVVVEMGWHRPLGGDDRRRVLRAWSRHEETPGQLVIALNEAGTEYRACGDETSSEFEAGWSVLRAVLKSEPRRLTRKEILERWPSEVERPSDVTLWRWLQRALERGLVERLGDGRASLPFRYTVAGRKFEDEDVLPPLHEAMGITERELFQRCKRAVERVTELDARFSAEQEES